MLHLQAIFRWVDNPALNAQLSDKVFEHSARLGETPLGAKG